MGSTKIELVTMRLKTLEAIDQSHGSTTISPIPIRGQRLRNPGAIGTTMKKNRRSKGKKAVELGCLRFSETNFSASSTLTIRPNYNPQRFPLSSTLITGGYRRPNKSSGIRKGYHTQDKNPCIGRPRCGLHRCNRTVHASSIRGRRRS